MHGMIRSHVFDFQRNLHKKPKTGFQIIVVKTEASLLFKLCVTSVCLKMENISYSIAYRNHDGWR
jgi:hypothetical protein